MTRAFVVYSLQRLLLLVVIFLLLTLVGIRGFVAILLALLISSILGLFLLRRRRDLLVREAAGRRESRLAERERLQQRLREEP